MFGPFDSDEIDFYYKELDGKITDFQKNLVFNLFYKYFGDPQAIKSLNFIQYIKLIMSAKRLLEGHNLRILPYIISGKFVKIVKRKTINKKELGYLMNSMIFNYVLYKYGIDDWDTNTASTVDTVQFEEDEDDGNLWKPNIDLDPQYMPFADKFVVNDPRIQKEEMKNKIISLIAKIGRAHV